MAEILRSEEKITQAVFAKYKCLIIGLMTEIEIRMKESIYEEKKNHLINSIHY
jgi:hypothetical protein